MNLVYTPRVSSKLIKFTSCILLILSVCRPEKISAQCVAPGTVTATAPSNISCSSFQANWNTPSGTVTNYQVELATAPDFLSGIVGLFETGSTSTSYSFTGLTAGASYYFRVMAIDSVSPSSVCFSPSWSALTIANLLANSATCQCTPINDLTCATDYISNVTINTLNNTSGCSTGGYSYYPPTGTQTTNLAIGATYTLTLTAGGANAGVHGAGVWFDFNQNSSLLDANEFFLVSNVITTGSSVPKNITIPSSATPGYTAMRVRYGIGETIVQSDACTMLPNTTDGETEDYSVCLYVPTNISLSPQNTTACVGATPVLFLGATGSGLTYQWYSNTTNTNTGGTLIPGATNSNYTPGSLPPGTYYYYCTLTNICGTPITTPTSGAAALTINPLPTVASISASPTVLCKGNPFMLIGNSATGVGTPTYNWTGPASYTQTTSSDTVIYTPTSSSASGTYSLVVTYPGAGCTSNLVTSPFITVNDSPSVASITATPSPLCTSALLTLSAGATTGAGTISSYNWSGPNGYTATTTTPTTTLTPSSLAASGKYVLTVTYPGAGCYSAADTSLPVIVDTAAGAITGNAAICYLGNTTFSNTTIGGTWSSSNTSVATIGSATGAVITFSSGTTNIIYSVTNSCGTTTSSATLTVNPLPLSITGNAPVCSGLSVCLSDPVSGGTWSSVSPSIANIGSTSGCITGLLAGTSIVLYTLPTGCITTTIATVNPLPANILGTKSVCLGHTTNLSDVTPGGTWSSSNIAVGSIGTNGVVSGLSVGTTVITYTLPTSCITTTIVTVNPLPSGITGTAVVCATLSTSLSDLTAGGTWSSSNTLQANVGTDGTVTGVGAGTPTITYTLPTGCIATQNVTVNPLSAILGTPKVCFGLTTTISDATPGGTWSSSNTNAAINSSTGVITGNTVGTSTITYLIAATGCAAYATATVNPLPSAITGNAPVCSGLTVCLTDADAGGEWSSSNTAIGTVTAALGCVTGALVAVQSTVTITYTLPTGCINTTIVTVNPLPAAITGTASICSGLSSCLTDGTSGGTWSVVSAILSVNGSTGCVATTNPGTATVSYTLPTGCSTTTVFTVNPFPGNISGPKVVCSGSTISLTDAGGGTWSSSDITVTVGSSSGNITAIAAGPATATITYTLPTSCAANIIITINPLPATITGISDSVCAGSTIALNDADGTGTWSSANTAIATIASSGIVTGANTGTAKISYTIATGCAATQIVTVNPLPSAITGNLNVCSGLTSCLSDVVAGGTWSISNTAIGSIGSASGCVNGISPGTATITYTLPTGCFVTAVATINPLPTAIIFLTPNAVCPGATISLSDATSGGGWELADMSIATIGSSSGFVTAVSGGTTTVTYTLPTGCIATTTITINAAPAVISGAPNICASSTSDLSDTPVGGTWSSSVPAIASIGSSSGTVLGTSLGTSVISYTISDGCAATLTVTVVSAVASITGITHVCLGLTTTLSDATIGGTWSSSGTTLAIPDPSSGAVTGNNSGTTTITYSLSSACTATTIVTVNPLPGNITGPNNVCVGSTISLTDAGGGTWSGSNGNATVGSSSGIVTGVVPGTWICTYTLATGCITTTTITVNPLPSAITGGTLVCSGASITLSDADISGTWSSNNAAIASVGSSSGIVTGHGVSAATTTITYTLPTGCKATTIVSVIVTIPAITGTATNCPQFPITLNDAQTGGAWSSSNAAFASVDVTGIVTDIPLTSGTATISYSLGGVCTVTKTVTFNTVPAISGPSNLCLGSTATLSNATLGGTWSSTNTGVATIGTSGLVTTVASGSTTISYILPGGCNTSTTITVVSTLPSLLGTLTVCKGSATSLSDGIVSGGTWTSSNANATVGSLSGLVTGANAGTSTITYKLGTGCTTTAVVTVNPLPAVISGATSMCQSASITLSDGTAGGTWNTSSSLILNPVATVTTVTATSAGTATVSYTLSTTGCSVATIITVNPTPATITGPTNICFLTGILESDATSGGTWSSSNTSVVFISGGAAFGVSVGTATITYQITATGCSISKNITVNPLPATISGAKTICAGLSTTLTDALSGGTWSSDNATIASINGTSGVVTGVATGTADITYTTAAGCTTDTVITVIQTPTPILGTPGVCVGLSTALSDTTAGGIWSSSNTSVASIGSGSGLASGVSTGTATISYTIATGCSITTTFTVNSFPATISGTTSVCPGFTTSLSSTTIGGTWSSNNTSIAAVNGTTGLVTGITPGTAVITYTSSAGCSVTTTVNVFPVVGPINTASTVVCVGAIISLTDTTTGGTWSASNGNILIGSATGIVTGAAVGVVADTFRAPTGCYSTITLNVINSIPAITATTLNVCPGSSITLSDAVTGGHWSTSSANASVGSATGIVTGITAGTAIITYSIGGVCTATAIVTVNGQPVTGITTVCTGATTTLSDIESGGIWSSGNTAIATINSSTGVVTGISMGTAIITYINPTGCPVTTTVNVLNTVGPITSASTVVCLGLTLNLFDTSIGGTWSSSNSNITIGSATGIVTGIALGTATSTYTAPSGCFSTATISVINSLPAITGTAFSTCPGGSVTLSDAAAGGNWSSSNPNVSVGSFTGVVYGITAGTANITYAIGAGCTITTIVTVNGQPITGVSTICIGATTTLSDVETGGTWSSPSATVFVGSSSGTVTGIAGGIANITYLSPTGCTITSSVSVVDTLPSIITIPPVCVGLTSNLFDAATGGTWSSSNIGIASVATGTGIVTGVGAGTVTITYTLATGCNTRTTLTVNPLSSILGTLNVCKDATLTLSDATLGGTWSASNANVIIGSASGTLTGLTPGTATIVYSLPSGCAISATVTVNPVLPITGITSICHPGTTTLSDAITGGTWSSGNTAIGSVGSSSGVVTSLAIGTTVITYTLPTGCISTTTVAMVSSLPAITGNTNDCIGVPSALSDAITGGIWSSNNTGIATVDPASGAVTGVFAGSTTITYRLGTGCNTTTLVSINPLPAAISGVVNVCVGLTGLFTDATTGGNWTSGNTAIAIVGSGSGIVTGISAGTSNVTYTTPAGCIATTIATIEPLPAAITGILNICPNLTTTLMDSATGGTWSSSNTSVGTIDVNTGAVTTLATGTSTITYTLPTGCITTAVLNVINIVAPISGTLKVCTNSTTNLSDIYTGGTWSSANANASVDITSGIVTGALTGTTTITYTLGSVCNVTAVVTINPAPPAMLGSLQVCLGASTILSDAISGTWSASNANVSITAVSGLIHSNNVGVDTITYTIATGCKIASVFTVNALPNIYLVNGGGSYCGGGSGVDIILNGSDTAINYQLYHGLSLATSAIGTGGIINFGPQTAVGSYSVLATNTITGCTSKMLDSATVSITTPLIPSILIHTASDTICIGTYTTFTATTVNGGTTPAYEWRVNGFSPGADSNHYSYVPVNGDIVTVKLTSNAVCALPDTAIDSIVMVVDDKQLPTVSISINPGDTLCAGALATFTAGNTFGGTTPSYTWYRNSTMVGTGNPYSFTPYIPNSGDIVYCKMTSNYFCITTDTVSSSYIHVIVDSSLIPIVTLTATPGTTILHGQSDTITANVTHAGVSPTYQWFVNGMLITGDTTNTFISDTLSNNDSVSCVVHGSGECGLYTFNSAIIITDGQVSVKQVSAGLTDLRLVPNPNNGSFTIRGTLATTLDEDVTVEITDMVGQVIFNKKIIATGGKINEQIKLNSTLSNGMYSLYLHSEHESKVFHLVIEQ